MTAIEVQGLSKTYDGGVEAVKSIDFTVAAGEVFGLLGPNGAGKSTTIGILTTTVAPTAGSARLMGYDVTTDPLHAPSCPSHKCCFSTSQQWAWIRASATSCSTSSAACAAAPT